MDGFDVTTAELHATAKQLAEITDELQTEVRALQAEMDSLFGGGWQGRAAQGFAEGWGSWQKGAGDVLAALAEMSSLLRVNGHTYTRSDAGGAGALERSGGGLL